MTNLEIYLLEVQFNKVESVVSDDLESINYKIDGKDYSISVFDYCCGLQRYSEVDSFTDEKVILLENSEITQYQTTNELPEKIETRDKIDFINESLSRNASKILKWFLRRKSRK